MLAFAIAIAVGIIGYFKTRSFVASRLRFVDSAQSRALPVVAGLGAWLVALPLVWLLPIVGGFTAIAAGVGVGTGAAVGAKDIRLARYKVDG